jgi:FAD dependent oxidoreductase TIGR03364
VDPREVIAQLPAWLADRFGVRFVWGCTALGYDRPMLHTSRGDVHAARLWVCSGDEIRCLYPATLADPNLVRCKLQMMRTEPLQRGQCLGPMIAAGLTLRHYSSFGACPSLPALKARFAAELPECERFGIHVMAAQNGLGELVLGDSHEYDPDIEPFDKTLIDQLVLRYLATFLEIPDLRIAAHWHGTYLKHKTESYLIAHPADGVTLVTAVGGAGMTLSFGLAEQTTRGQAGDP